MNVLVIYESMYGNTHEIAEAIADGMRGAGEVQVAPVTSAPAAAAEADVLVVGGPTHVHGMSRKSSRLSAAETAESDDSIELDPDAEGDGLREWFDQLPKASGSVSAAAFDTRIDKPAIFTGSAAKGIAKQLRRHRYQELASPESFLVEDTDGPLKAGEIDRARRWGEELAKRCREQT